MKQTILLCTDLDRTLIPNGPQPESVDARRYFSNLVSMPEVCLAYVTGRHLALVEQAISEYALPMPDYILADVGTTIYWQDSGGWNVWQDWSYQIAGDWSGLDHEQVKHLFTGIPALIEQEAEKQGLYKLSYYLYNLEKCLAIMETMQDILESHQVRASLIWSVDETSATGLLDVIPENATKLHAVEFLMQRKGFNYDTTVFAGDSGNDLPVLASSVKAVLVANATDEVKRQAQELAVARQNSAALYIAKGGVNGLNGNYSAGILEGLAYYLPETLSGWNIQQG